MIQLPKDCVVGLQGHDKPMCELIRRLKAAGVRIGGLQTVKRNIHEKDAREWTGYLLQRGLYESVHDCAEENGVELLEVDDVHDPGAIQWFRQRGVNFILSCTSRFLLKASYLEEFNHMAVNFHPSMLPQYGGGPVQSWQILNNEMKGGWTAHWMDTGIDRGDLLCQLEYELPAMATTEQILKVRLQNAGALFDRFIAHFKEGQLPKTPMNLDERLYFFSLYTPRDARIDLRWSYDEIERFVRAFGFPYAGAFGHFKKSNGQFIKVHLGRVETAEISDREFHPFLAGNILRYTPEGGVIVNLAKGVMNIVTVRDGYDEIPAGQVLKLGGRFLRAEENPPELK